MPHAKLRLAGIKQDTMSELASCSSLLESVSSTLSRNKQQWDSFESIQKSLDSVLMTDHHKSAQSFKIQNLMDREAAREEKRAV